MKPLHEDVDGHADRLQGRTAAAAPAAIARGTEQLLEISDDQAQACGGAWRPAGGAGAGPELRVGVDGRADHLQGRPAAAAPVAIARHAEQLLEISDDQAQAGGGAWRPDGGAGADLELCVDFDGRADRLQGRAAAAAPAAIAQGAEQLFEISNDQAQANGGAWRPAGGAGAGLGLHVDVVGRVDCLPSQWEASGLAILQSFSQLRP